MANPPPNLADILRTLSALAPQPQQQDEQQTASNPSNPYHFSAPIPQPRPPFEVPSRPPQPQPTPAAPIQDASKITDWPTALRCVMRSVASNERVVGEIRKLIQTQHEHETQWCAGRRELAMKIEARKVGQKKLDDVLRAVGGQVTENPTPPSDGAEELRTFDGKVYRAQCQMVVEMGGKLQRLGVPFFGTRPELIRHALAPILATASAASTTVDAIAPITAAGARAPRHFPAFILAPAELARAAAVAERVERGVLVERDEVGGVRVAEDVAAATAVVATREVREGACA
ncbi:hypothetical protein V495_08162 [Pseudogymnoascus sp. VKM F-4514 (FW-929)]|nr:hypothetical protein V495_08162 [Pseudogymnoascus sp. VKM F-4514 (FW-929)]KFY62147.1 hypothetical protein V497_02557 [Pseudogymnoascus sp. VKM F-4516 (FW-969)]